MAERLENFLIVDDSQANSLFFEVLLNHMGYKKIFKAPTSTKALDLVEKENIHFVIAAWELKPLSGTVFVQRARESRIRRHMPFVLYSKSMSDEDVRLTRELGLTNLLSMPFSKDDAMKLIQDLIDHENSLPATELTLRRIERNLEEGHPAQAVHLITPGLTKVGPLEVRAKTVIAEVWLQLRKFEKAEPLLNEVLTKEKYAPALHCLARLHSLKGETDKAITILEEMSVNSPKNISTMYNLGSAYLDNNQVEKAKQTYGKISDLDEDSSAAKDGLGKIAFKEGNLELAKQLLRETRNGDEMARFFNATAIAQVAKGQFDVGIKTYHDAMNILSDKGKMPLLKYNLGLAFKKKGDLDNSFRTLSECYIADPDFEKAYSSLVKVAKEIEEAGGKPDKTVIKEVMTVRRSKVKPDSAA